MMAAGDLEPALPLLERQFLKLPPSELHELPGGLPPLGGLHPAPGLELLLRPHGSMIAAGARDLALRKIRSERVSGTCQREPVAPRSGGTRSPGVGLLSAPSGGPIIVA
jgi:hypothetical protein